MGEQLRQRLAGGGIVRAPGAHDAMAGLIAREAGFDVLYVSGAAVTASRSLPDLGVLPMEELTGTVRSIARATGLPLIVDGDTGYGEALNAIWPVSSLRIAAHAMEAFFAALARDGTTAPQLDRMQTRKRLYELIGYHDYESLDASIVRSIVPEKPG